MKEKDKVISSQTVDSFIRSIQALNFTSMKEYLNVYRQKLVNRLESRTRMPSLYFAININNQRTALTVIKELVSYGAFLQFHDLFGNGYLHYTCNVQKLPIFKFLVQSNLNINQQNIFKQSILFSIAQNNHLEVIQLKVRHGVYLVEINQEDALGRTALFYAAEKGHFQMCEILLKMGADVNKIDQEGHNAVYFARKLEKPNIANLIMQYKKKQKEYEISENRLVYNLYHLSPKYHPSVLSIEQTLQFLQSRQKLKQLFTDPKLIQETGQQQQNDWRQKAHKIIDQCLSQQGSKFFQYPVNQEMFGISDYYKRIQRPMDFSTIKCRLIYNGYANSGEFIKDVELIFENCRTYNGEGHYITIIAMKIRDYFREICIF